MKENKSPATGIMWVHSWSSFSMWVSGDHYVILVISREVAFFSVLQQHSLPKILVGYKNWFHINSITSTVVSSSQIPREKFAFGWIFTWQNRIWLNSNRNFGFGWIPREDHIWLNFKWMLDFVEFQEKIAFNWIWRENYWIWLNSTENTDCWKF